MTAKPQINVKATESSYLSKRTPSHILDLICTTYMENKQIVYQTLPASKFFSESNRQVEAVSPNETRVLYHITFDKKIVKQGLGFNLPTFIIYLVAKTDMKKYLTKLKSVIEANNAQSSFRLPA
jgi:mRNA-degrading endonuclease HigB of HigAB toxin-antitoxin module